MERSGSSELSSHSGSAASLGEDEIAGLLVPFLPNPPQALLKSLVVYLDVLLKWNAHTNLTSIRTPSEIVTRHFGESLFAAQHVGAAITVLDFGSGAGFPGLPTAILKPNLSVTLAESQGKKVSFLREVTRELSVPVTVWPKRVEDMPSERRFDCVMLRAVDDMKAAIESAARRASKTLLILTTSAQLSGKWVPEGFEPDAAISIPNSSTRVVQRLVYSGVPRGT